MSGTGCASVYVVPQVGVVNTRNDFLWILVVRMEGSQHHSWRKFYVERKHRYKARFPFLGDEQIAARLRKIWTRDKLLTSEWVGLKYLFAYPENIANVIIRLNAGGRQGYIYWLRICLSIVCLCFLNLFFLFKEAFLKSCHMKNGLPTTTKKVHLQICKNWYFLSITLA